MLQNIFTTVADMSGIFPNTPSLEGTLQKIVTFIFALMGIVAVFVIIYAGFMMMTSSGDPGKVKKGKDTILWGIIGLIVAILAYAIVNFVLGQLGLKA